LRLERSGRLIEQEMNEIMALTLKQNPGQVFPENILEEKPNGTTWWVAHTKSRREKKLAGFLASREIGYYLPLIKQRQASNRRERYSFMPLFSGYLFFKGTKQDRYEAYTSNQIARVIEVKNQDMLINELSQTQHLLSNGAPVFPYDFLAEGQRVKVKQGPLQGVEGIITNKKGGYRLVLNITTISHSVAVHIEADMVEAL
jgi:transcription antitermination factor NusG